MPPTSVVQALALLVDADAADCVQAEAVLLDLVARVGRYASDGADTPGRREAARRRLTDHLAALALLRGLPVLDLLYASLDADDRQWQADARTALTALDTETLSRLAGNANTLASEARRETARRIRRPGLRRADGV
jgi:hypothetical protein